MDTTQALIIVFLILLAGFLLLQIFVNLAELTMKKKVSFSALFKNFNQKIWMTGGLGILFFGLYFLLISAFSFFNDPTLRLNFFHFAYRHPVTFVYAGLMTFICVSISIYLARSAIAYLYNKKKR